MNLDRTKLRVLHLQLVIISKLQVLQCTIVVSIMLISDEKQIT